MSTATEEKVMKDSGDTQLTCSPAEVEWSWKAHYIENKKEYEKIKNAMSRNDIPKEFAKSTPELMKRFRSDLSAAEHAAALWQREAYLRLVDAESLLDVRYFAGLTATLTLLADLLDMRAPSLELFNEATTLYDNFMPVGRKSKREAGLEDLVRMAGKELVRLLGKIGERSAKEVGDPDVAAPPDQEQRWSEFRTPKEWRRQLKEQLNWQMSTATFARLRKRGELLANPKSTTKSVSLDLTSRRLAAFNDSR